YLRRDNLRLTAVVRTAGEKSKASSKENSRARWQVVLKGRLKERRRVVDRLRAAVSRRREAADSIKIHSPEKSSSTSFPAEMCSQPGSWCRSQPTRGIHPSS